MPWARLPTPLRLLLLTALCTSTTSALPASRIFAREDTCGADRVSCNSDLTDIFCCPKDYSCILLAGDTSAMCCPAGRNCNEVKPITCDLRGQDITKYPKAPVMTIITNLKLETCGTMCCPFGYSCEGDSKCVLDEDQSSPPEGAEYPSGTSSAAPSATSPTSSETASASAEPTSTSEPSKASDENQKEDPEEEEKKDSGPATTSIVGGVVGGCIILLIIAVVIFLYFRRQKKREGGHGEKGGHFYGGGGSTSSSEASFGNFISEPIVQPNSYRADFILKTPSQNSQVSGGSSSVPQSQFSGAHSQFSGASSSVPQRQFSMSPTPTRIPQGPPRIRISIPNPFDSPNPSPNHKSAQMSPIDDTPVRHGTVRLPPIRAMKASSQISRRPDSPDLQREPSCESINVFADPSDVVKPRRLTRGTTFTDLMDEADLRGVGRGKAYAPGTKPHVPGTTPRI
ncbi:hypothetical protein CDV36_007723 [Fusarium kuroshium]|uniref:receptor protein-tyrosine kinase n=4 Tax=Fusarium solani species complex TaxID=232080 RepID=A0A3M2S4Z4_9HYPO|nr:hypothetical protein CDV36_007723 [Fusarium kuroshium]RSL38551.1 hypothetical protein CEP53_014776 [Fusarium sp. AF-6]RSL79258.1 hypothetical protein CEP51_007507 [Fusarium floridanum]RSM15612.1 hypothetical protein CEP52_000689 [Fusarium oligoseptatum]RSM20823.1 hypothetical protein CDV31_000194 [Fusarium ambrosium]